MTKKIMNLSICLQKWGILFISFSSDFALSTSSLWEIYNNQIERIAHPIYAESMLVVNDTDQTAYSLTTHYDLLVGPINEVSDEVIHSFIQIMDRHLVKQLYTKHFFKFSASSTLKNKKKYGHGMDNATNEYR